MLLLDKAPGHPANLSELVEGVEVEFLPNNTTALIQTMDQGAISTFKTPYLRKAFQELIAETDVKEKPTVKTFWKGYDIKKSVENIGEVSNEIYRGNVF